MTRLVTAVAVGVVALAVVVAPATGAVLTTPSVTIDISVSETGSLTQDPPDDGNGGNGAGSGNGSSGETRSQGNHSNNKNGSDIPDRGPVNDTPSGVEGFLNTSPLAGQQTDPSSLAGKIRVETEFKNNTTVTLVKNSSTNYTLAITIPNATNVTFYLQEQAVSASQNISNVSAHVNGTPVAFGTTQAANSSWITFEIDHFSTKRVSFTSNSTSPDNGTQNATFAVSDLNAPDNATQGDTIGVNATITNTGNESGQTTVKYRFNGTVRNSTSVSLDANNSTVVEFTFDTGGIESGTYTHGVYTVDDNETTQITIKAAEQEGGNQTDRGPEQGPPPQDLAAFQSTSPLAPQQTDPNSLSGKIRVESQYKSTTTITLVRNSSTNYTLKINIPNATNVTFFIQEQAVTASQNISDVKLLIDGNQTDFYVNESAGPGRSPWILFEVRHFSTRTATFTSEGASPFSAPVPGTGADTAPTDPDGDGLFEDVNGDGQTGFDDAVSLAFAEFDKLTQEQVNALDFNGDGDVDFADAVELAFSV